MSHSAWLIRPPAEQKTQVPASGPISGKKAQASPDKARFAALMAGEKGAEAAQAAAQTAAAQAAAAQNTAAQNAAKSARSAQFQPQVARLPEDNTTLPLRNTVLAGRSPSDLLRSQNFT
ncbi:MAG: hypothetical protein K2N07_06100, partial [Desulfovibrio sp.]|nr:hypothetical protein [Desulfovibrio sp.]